MQNSFSYERFRTLTRFETEAQENSEMAYSFQRRDLEEERGLLFLDSSWYLSLQTTSSNQHAMQAREVCNNSLSSPAHVMLL